MVSVFEQAVNRAKARGGARWVVVSVGALSISLNGHDGANVQFIIIASEQKLVEHLFRSGPRSTDPIPLTGNLQWDE